MEGDLEGKPVASGRLPRSILQSLVEQSGGIQCFMDRRGVVVAFSDPFAQAFLPNETRRSMRGRRLVDVMSLAPDVGQGLDEWWDRLLGGERHTISTAVAVTGGEVRYYDVDLRPIRGAKERVLGVILEARDVTDARARALAEERTRLSERRHHAFFNQGAVGIILADPEGRFVEVNDRFCEIVGRSREELIGMTFLDVTHPNDLAENLALKDQIDQTGGAAHIEKRYLRPDGEVVWVRVWIHVILDDERRPVWRQAVILDITARIQAEQEVRRQLATITAINDNAASALLLLDRKGRILEANASYTAITGYTRADLVGRNAPELLHAHRDALERGKAEDCAICSAFLHGTPLRNHEETFAHRDGRSIAVMTSFTPISGEDGNARGGVLEFRDVSAEKAAELELRHRHDRFEFLIEAIPFPIWTTDPKGKVTAANAMVRERNNLNLEEVMAGRFRERSHPDDRIRMRLEWERCRQTGAPMATHCRSLVEGLGYRWHLIMAKPRVDEGRIVEWICTAIDVHDQIERERALELTIEVSRLLSKDLDLQRVLQTLTDSAIEATGATGGAYLSIDADTSTVSVRAVAGRPGDASKEPPLEAKDKALADSLGTILRIGDMASGDSAFREALFRHLPAGRGKFSSYLSVPIGARSGKLQGALCLVHTLPHRFTDSHESLVSAFASQAAVAIENATLYKDQSRLNAELVVARDSALAASKAKSAFLANMSHEVRTPLNGVIGTASHLRELGLGPEVSGMVDTILASGERLLRILDDVLDLASVEQGTLEIETTVCDLAIVARKVCSRCREKADDKRLPLAFSGPTPGEAMVLADPKRLEQVLANLVTNAVKFTETGGVQLLLDHRTRHGIVDAKFRVIDTGIGIPEDRMREVFDSFEQADGSQRRVYGGPGLGLTIAYRLIALMGGKLSVASEVGKGTTFEVHLAFPVAPERDSEPPEILPGTDGPRVLLAEDNKVNVVVARRILERHGCKVEVAEDGLKAIELAKGNDYDLVLMDLQMPECDGFEATRRIRRDIDPLRGARLPIYALTANAMPEDRAASILAGMDGFLTKPVTTDAIRRLLRQLPESASMG